jgi:hypothetical protein
MEDVGLFYSHLVNYTALWSIIPPFGIFYSYVFGIFVPVLVCCTKKNLATVQMSRTRVPPRYKGLM